MLQDSFSTQEGKAYYYNSITEFHQGGRDLHNRAAHQARLRDKRGPVGCLQNQIYELQTKLRDCGVQGDVIFEYDIIRMVKRIDVVLLIKHMVFSLEFKNGKSAFVASDAQQAEDYGIDLKNFHKESEDLYVCPILITTEAKPATSVIDAYPDKQVYL